MIVRFAIQQLSTPATCIARNACTGVLYCAHGKSDDHVFRISAECLTLVRSLLIMVDQRQIVFTSTGPNMMVEFSSNESITDGTPTSIALLYVTHMKVR